MPNATMHDLHVITGLSKSASKAELVGKLGRGIRSLVVDGVWKNVASRTANSTGRLGRTANLVSRAFYNPVTGSNTMLAKGLNAYGFGGMMAGMAGVNLPGSTMAFNLGMPGAAAIFAAPNLVTLGRAGSRKNQRLMREDADAGARQAGSHFLTAMSSDPRVATSGSAYEKFMRDNGIEFGRADYYASDRYKPMNLWNMAGAVFDNPQEIINDRMDRAIFDTFRGMGKSGSMRKQALMGGLRSAGRIAGKVLPWTVPVGGVGMLGYSIFSKKPYDEAEAQSRGYSAAQARIREALNGMNTMERFAAGFDPTLVARKLEEKMPGTIAQWESDTGSKFQPGWISRSIDAWNSGGKGKYYTYDAGGSRRYIG